MPGAFDERLLRELAPQVLGAVARRFRDFAAAEDAAQEAVLAAFAIPHGPGVPYLHNSNFAPVVDGRFAF